MPNNKNILTGLEIGYTDSKTLWYTGTPLNPDELVRMRGIGVYRKMLLDGQVQACSQLRKLPLIAKGWTIEAANADVKTDLEIRDFVEHVLDGVKGYFGSNLSFFLSALDYGFSVSEKIFEKRQGGKYSGFLILSAIKGKNPDGIDFVTDAFGNLEKITQLSGTVALPPEKFVVCTYDKQAENFYGNGILRPAYYPYFSKEITRKYLNIHNERFGMPTVVAEVPSTLQHLNSTIDDIINNIQAKTSIRVPEGIVIKLLEAQRASGEGAFLNTLRFFNAEIATAMLIPSNLGFSPQGSTGSYAQAATQFESFLEWVVAPDRQFLEDIVNEQVVKQLVDLNFYSGGSYPIFRLNSLTGLERAKLADIWIRAVSGNVVTQNLEDENAFRKTLGMPVAKQDKIEVQPVKTFAKSSPSSLEVFAGEAGNKAFDTLERDAKALLTPVMKKIKRDVVTYLESKKEIAIQNVGSVTQGIVFSNLDVAYVDIFSMFFRAGEKLAKELIARGQKTFAVSVGSYPPKEALEFFKKKAFYAADAQKEWFRYEIRSILLFGIENGKTLTEMTDSIEGMFDELGASDDDRIPVYRLETIIRTNMADVFNKAMISTYRQDDVAQYIEGVQYSAIIDTRTTPVCKFLHEKQFALGDVEVDKLSPPNHHSCRSMWLPVFIKEDLKKISKSEVSEAKDLVSKGFY